MKIIVTLLLLLLLAGIAYFFWQGRVSQGMTALGLDDNGRLAVCSDKPNCVCSEYPEQVNHFIEPLAIRAADIGGLWLRVAAAVRSEGGVVITQEGDYLAATYRSAIFGFVDDVEFRLDTDTNVLHIRSASRVGHSDFGVNNKRVSRLRDLLGSN